MLDLEALPGADPRRAGDGAGPVAGRPARRRRGRHAAAAPAPGRPAAATGHRRPRAGRRRRPRPPRAAPYGDLDLVLVHDGRPEIAAVADALWYPDLGRRPAAGPLRAHGGRGASPSPPPTSRPGSACSTPASSPATPSSPPACARPTLAGWRQAASRRLPELQDLRRGRARQVGELAFLLEPDLKEAYGGLRDVHVLRAVAASWLADAPRAEVEAAYPLLLDVRDALHRRAGRGRPTARPPGAGPGRRRPRTRRRGRAAARGQPRRPRDWRSSPTRPGGASRRPLVRRPARPVPAGSAASRSPRASSARTARWCSPATPSPTATRCCCCGPRPPPRGRLPLVPVHAQGAGRALARPLPVPWPRRGALVLPPAAGQRPARPSRSGRRWTRRG